MTRYAQLLGAGLDKVKTSFFKTPDIHFFQSRYTPPLKRRQALDSWFWPSVEAAVAVSHHLKTKLFTVSAC